MYLWLKCRQLAFLQFFFISILSVFFLGEKIGYRRIIAVIFGFIGVVIILNPGSAIFSNYSFLPLIASFFFIHCCYFSKKNTSNQ